jgi:hypothetical protein
MHMVYKSLSCSKKNNSIELLKLTGKIDYNNNQFECEKV